MESVQLNGQDIAPMPRDMLPGYVPEESPVTVTVAPANVKTLRALRAHLTRLTQERDSFRPESGSYAAAEKDVQAQRAKIIAAGGNPDANPSKGGAAELAATQAKLADCIETSPLYGKLVKRIAELKAKLAAEQRQYGGRGAAKVAPLSCYGIAASQPFRVGLRVYRVTVPALARVT